MEDGKAKLAVIQTPKGLFEKKCRVVNIPMDKSLEEVKEEERVKVEGYKWVRDTFAGPYVTQLKGGKEAVVAAAEGMWEEKRGRKIDGGERRQAQVRFKKRVAERKAQREAAGFH